jgi:hypothetical protein
MRAPWNHRRRCVDHVVVDGAGRVCVLRGQDPIGVIDFAELMVRLADQAGMRIPKPGAPRRSPSAEQLRHASCAAHVDGRPYGFGRLCIGRGVTPADVVAFAVELAEAGAALERLIQARAELALAMAPAPDAEPFTPAGDASWATRALARQEV